MKKLISVITPCFNEEKNIQDCYEVTREIFERELPHYDYEHIFTDNASTDSTVVILKSIAEKDKRIKILVNTRNFGPNRSNYNALIHAKGDAIVVLLAADLQDPPSLIPEFVKKWEEGYKVVNGIRKNREENFFLQLSRKIYYRVVTRLSDIRMPVDAGEFQLIDKCVLDNLKEHHDYFPYIRGMVASSGYQAFGIPFLMKKRKKGKSKTSIYDLIDQGLNGIISFSNVPLRLISLMGIMISVLSILYAVVEIIINIIYFRQFAPPGNAIIVVAIFFFAGVQLFVLGLMGEYIGAIHFLVRKRPMVVVKEKVNFD